MEQQNGNHNKRRAGHKSSQAPIPVYFREFLKKPSLIILFPNEGACGRELLGSGRFSFDDVVCVPLQS